MPEQVATATAPIDQSSQLLRTHAKQKFKLDASGVSVGSLTRSRSRVDDVHAVRGHEAALRVRVVSTDGSSLSEERGRVVVAKRFAAFTYSK